MGKMLGEYFNGILGYCEKKYRWLWISFPLRKLLRRFCLNESPMGTCCSKISNQSI